MATETLHADAVLANAGCSSPANAVGAPDATWTGNTDGTNWNCRWSLANPANPLTPGATHTVTARVRKSASLGNGDPTVRVDLYDNGVLVKTVIASQTVGDLTTPLGTDLTGSFSTAEVSSGGNVQLLVDVLGVGGSPSGRRNVQVDALTLTATTSASTSLTVAGGEHSHQAQAVGLTQTHALSSDGAAHGHTADAIALGQIHALTVQDAAHASTASSPSVSVATDLAVNAATSAHTADPAALTQTHGLAVQGAASGLTSPDVGLTQDHHLATQTGSHAHTSDGLTLTATGASDLTVASGQHPHAAAVITLTQLHTVTVAGGSHPHVAALIDLTLPHVLVVADGLHVTAADSPLVSPPSDWSHFECGEPGSSATEGGTGVRGARDVQVRARQLESL